MDSGKAYLRPWLDALLLAILSSTFLSATACIPSPARSPNRGAILPHAPIRGFALGLYSKDPAYDYAALLAEIRATGARWVSLYVSHFQERFDSNEIMTTGEQTASFERVRRTIRSAHGYGLSVAVVPIVLLVDAGENYWRGTLAPADRALWHASYAKLLEMYATLAHEEGVEMLSIGSEFNSLERDTAAWQALLAGVRERFHGLVTYSVNWDSLNGPTFFDSLDVVGMSTYFSIGPGETATPEQLHDSWEKISKQLVDWMRKLGKPVLFTEVGYCSQPGANSNPWNYCSSAEVDLHEQARCYRAFTDVWIDEPLLAGVFFYDWFGFGGPHDNGYTPRGKPALGVLKEWFSSPPQATRNESPCAPSRY